MLLQKMKTYEKEMKSGERLLNANLFKAFMSIFLPVLLYGLLNFGYDYFDTIIISQSGIGTVDSIYILTEIKRMLAALGTGLITGAIIVITQRLGAKKYEDAKGFLNTIFYILMGISFLMIVTLIPSSTLFLKLLQTPETVIGSATGYFSIQVLVVVLEWFNSLFIGIQKAKGRAHILFYLNIGVIAIKMGLTTLFVYGNLFTPTVTHLALATVLAQLFMFIFGCISLFNKNSIISVSLKNRPTKAWWIPIVKLGIPIFLGNFIFYFTKVFINSLLAVFFNTNVLAAMGIVSLFSAFFQQFIDASGSAVSVLTGQNYGNGQLKRTKQSYYLSMLFVMGISLIYIIIVSLLGAPLSALFSGADQAMVYTLLQIEKFDALMNAIITCCIGFLNGIGKTKYTMMIYILRTVIIRIPLLYLFYYVWHFDYSMAWLIIVYSNAIGAAFALTTSLWNIQKKLKRQPPITPLPTEKIDLSGV